MHTQPIHGHTNTFKATKDIAPGQEIFVLYGSAEWFKHKNIPHFDVDYATTMWRPDLRPLPCRQNVRHAGGADGQHSFAVLGTIPSGTVLEISLCVAMALNVVDQFPFLWDFVIMDTTSQTVCAPGDAGVYWQPVCSYVQISPCHIPQACIPLSYAAKIPTTPNPDLANVHVSLEYLDQEVRQCSAWFFVSVKQV